MKIFSIIVRMLIGIAVGVNCELVEAAVKTSIVLLLSDDVGYGDVGYVNKLNPAMNGARTPTLDAMAASSHTLRLTNFHMSSTSCSPSRSSLISGRFPERECVLGANAAFDVPGKPYRDTFPFRNGMGSIAKEAQRAGYATAFFGKWHLGPIPARGPGTMGFDTWIASPDNIPTYDPACFESEWRCEGNCGSRGDMCFRPGGRQQPCSSSKKCYLGHYSSARQFVRNWSAEMWQQRLPPDAQHVVEKANITRNVPTAEYLLDRFEQFARSVPKAQPIFAYVWFYEPHTPIVAAPQLAAGCAAGIYCKYPIARPNGTVTLTMDYYGVLIALDRAVGRVRTLLRDLGRAENTILIFTSDNGPAPPAYIGGAVGSPWPFTGYKTGIGEGSHRVPGLIEWPARISANAAVKGITSGLDLFNTFLDVFISENPALANGTIRVRKPDGISLLPLLNSDQPSKWTRPGPLGVCQPIGNTQRFCNTFTWLSGKYRLLINRPRRRQRGYHINQARLYDIEADPLETNNLASANPLIVQVLFPAAIQWIKGIVWEVNHYCR